MKNFDLCWQIISPGLHGHRKAVVRQWAVVWRQHAEQWPFCCKGRYMKILPMPSQKFLQECFDYSFATGVLTWKVRPRSHFVDDWHMKTWNARQPGRTAGCRASVYPSVKINGSLFLAHRVIFKLVTGFEPSCVLDHRNGNTQDSRISNLRETNQSSNCHNVGARRKNKIGAKGVYFRRNLNKFVAAFMVNGRTNYLGVFETVDEAKCSYRIATESIQGKFAYHNRPPHNS